MRALVKLAVIAAGVLFSAMPANAGLYFDWSYPLKELWTYPSSYGTAYNPPGTNYDPGYPGPGWYELGFGDGYDFFSDDPAYFPAFILKSNSGQTGSARVRIKAILSGQTSVGGENVTDIQFYSSGQLGYSIWSPDDPYGNSIDIYNNIDIEDSFNQTSYTRVNSSFAFLEIGKLYKISGDLMNFPPYVIEATPIDPLSPAYAVTEHEFFGNLTLATPEPLTVISLLSGLIPLGYRRWRKSLVVSVS